MELHVAVKEMVDRLGSGVLDDAAAVRGALDDVLDESTASVGHLNLLVDAVRLGAITHLTRTLDTGAEPTAAVAMAGARLARDRGSADEQASSWACAVWGFALGLVAEDVVRRLAIPARTPEPAPVTQAAPGEPGANGAPTVPAPLQAPVPSRTWEAPPTRPRMGYLTAALVLLAVAATVGVGTAVVLLMADRDVEANDPTAAASSSSVSESDVATPSPSVVATTGTTTEPSTEPSTASTEVPTEDVRQQSGVRCWNGVEVAGLAGCSYPQGVEGLVWVFPGADDSGCGGVARGHHGRVVDRYCSVLLPHGAEVQLHFSQWRDFDLMRFNYRADQAGPDLAMDRDDLHAFAVADVDAAFKVAVYYRLPQAPWSVTVYAASDADLGTALELLEVRPVKQLRGVGRQQQHVPVSFRVLPPGG